MKLKWGMEYKGYLVSVDAYMNLQVCKDSSAVSTSCVCALVFVSDLRLVCE
jgi:hypothetical protein